MRVPRPVLGFLAAWTLALQLTGCSDNDSTDTPSFYVPAGDALLVGGSDYKDGVLSWMGVSDSAILGGPVEIHQDSRLRVFGGNIYVLEGPKVDNLLKISGANFQTVYQSDVSGTEDWNLHDIEFVSETKAYLSCNSRPALVVVNPSTGSATGKTIDISAYAFKGGNPCASQMALDGERLYVSLQRLDGWNPGGNTIILVVDTKTDAVADSITTPHKNASDMALVDGQLVVANADNQFRYDTLEGAIDVIQLSNKKVTTSVTARDLGGIPMMLAHKSGSRYYVSVATAFGKTGVVDIDVSSGKVIEKLSGVVDALGGICYDKGSGRLFVGDRDAANSGVKIYENNKLVRGPIRGPVGLPPYALALFSK